METSSELEVAPGPIPAGPTPIADIVAALRKVEGLDGLNEQDYLWLAENGTERKVGPGTMIFREGDPPLGMNILLAGEIHVRRSQSGNLSLFIARVGQLSGLLPFSRMKGYGGNGYSVGYAWSLDIAKEKFPEMLAAIPSMAQRCVSVLLNRVREVTRIELQAEKLTALGKLAANLAHELNNPASAAQRSAASLFGELRSFGDLKQQLGATLAEAGQFALYQDWARRTREKMAGYKSRAILPDNPLDLSDREELFRVWLEAHGIPEPWTIASVVAESPMTIAHLEELAALLSPQALAVSAASLLQLDPRGTHGRDRRQLNRPYLRPHLRYQGLLLHGSGAHSGDRPRAVARYHPHHVQLAPGSRPRRAPVRPGSTPHQRLRQRAQPGLD